MGAPLLGSMAVVSPLSLLFLLSNFWAIHGRSIEVTQSRRNFDLAKGEFGEVIETITSKFLDTDRAWTKDSCLNLPISNKQWVVDRIDYNPSKVNPDSRWFLKSIVLFSGFNCKTTYHGAPPPPIRIDIENVEELETVPAWLQVKNYPYFGMTYDPVVDPGSIKIHDPEKLLGRPMTIDERMEADWKKGQGYLEMLGAENLRRQGKTIDELMSEEDQEILEMEALREFSKLETTQYDVWPRYQFFGQVSIRLEWDMELFHVSSDEEWMNRFDLGEEIVPATGGSFHSVFTEVAHGS
ncbi:hypothetical protein TWF718_011098 [Orbilia javanica]|uniref:Uncharacterized protein n=1 Tax=Orbilia javanica TaxID=47235 RepID=A0AAN8MIL1_9PEZI